MSEDRNPCKEQERHEVDTRQESTAKCIFTEDLNTSSTDSFGNFYDDIETNLKKRKKKSQGLKRRHRNKNTYGRRRNEELNEITGK